MPSLFRANTSRFAFGLPALTALYALLAGAGCAAEPLPQPPSPAQPAIPQATAPSLSAQAPAPPPKPGASYENPGGMWMPTQMGEHAETLKRLGLELDPSALANPTMYPLGAVVSLGGCSASFVSPEGLVITNHHCVTRALQLNSTPTSNLLEKGYVARTRADEKSSGPMARVYVTQSFQDVTQRVRNGIEKIDKDLDRYKKMENETKKIIAECEKDRPEIRCSVGNFFGSAQYYLIEQLEIKDVRLVYAPHEGVGNFGGEIDNWRWPRHAGDFAMLRAYVGKDGKPAFFSPENVPYKPKMYLKLAEKPLEEGDLVFVTGYPGKTNRLRVAAEVNEWVSHHYPRRIQFAEQGIALLESLSKGDPERALKANPMIRGLNNGLTKMRGTLEGLVKGGLSADKAKLENDLRVWIDSDQERKKSYGDVFDKMNGIIDTMKKHRSDDALLDELLGGSGMLRVAMMLVRMAEERDKRDEDRDIEFQQRNWKRMEQGLSMFGKTYDRVLDQGMLSLSLARAAKVPAKERSEILKVFVGKDEPTEERIQKAVTPLYTGTKLENEDERMNLFQKAKLSDLKKSKDTMIQLALKLRPLDKLSDDREEEAAGALAMQRPRYIEALRRMTNAPIAPDANGTLRLTFGTVKSLKLSADAPLQPAFTHVSEMLKKNTGTEPFAAPANMLAAAKAKNFGPYAAPGAQDLVLDFLSDLDITGGNSGSPTLNARGELVGLAFDGNYESVASDWLFMQKVTRTIHVDLRYVLWVLDAVDKADHLLIELGRKPSID